MQIEVEDAEVMPFPTTRQTLQEMLMDEEEKDFWDDAEPAPSQERATVADAPSAKRCGAVRCSSTGDICVRYSDVVRSEKSGLRVQQENAIRTCNPQVR